MDKDDRLEQSGIDFHERVYQGYLKLLKDYGDRIISIDAHGSIEDINKNIIDELVKRGVL
jgi:dTMP kinase